MLRPIAKPTNAGDLAGHLKPVVQPIGLRVTAQNYQVSDASAGLCLAHYMQRRLDGLQALDLPQRLLSPCAWLAAITSATRPGRMSRS